MLPTWNRIVEKVSIRKEELLPTQSQLVTRWKSAQHSSSQHFPDGSWRTDASSVLSDFIAISVTMYELDALTVIEYLRTKLFQSEEVPTVYTVVKGGLLLAPKDKRKYGGSESKVPFFIQ